MKKSGKFISSTVIAAIAAVSVVTSASAESTYAGNVSRAVPSISSIDLSSMDLEMALKMVQSQRASLLEAQLQTQIQEVQNRNQMIAELNIQLQAATQSGDTAKAQLLKSQIDSLSNAQQMDMLRLQSLSNKRNEAFDLMTNFIKKMQDSRSSIIGNMR